MKFNFECDAGEQGDREIETDERSKNCCLR